jgi:hypothetical protein
MTKTATTILTLSLLLVGTHAAQAGTITIGEIMITTTLVGDAINVDVANVPGGDDFGLFGDSGGNRAFGFNVVDPDDTVSISNLTAGFTYAGPGVTDLGGGLGDFEFVINGPHSASDATLPLHFTVTRGGGFASDSDLFESNALGNVFGAHVHDLDGGHAGFVAYAPDAGEGSNTPVPTVPEPGSLVLLGSGLALVARRVRNRR